MVTETTSAQYDESLLDQAFKVTLAPSTGRPVDRLGRYVQ
jgi:hypothetical protein